MVTSIHIAFVTLRCVRQIEGFNMKFYLNRKNQPAASRRSMARWFVAYCSLSNSGERPHANRSRRKDTVS